MSNWREGGRGPIRPRAMLWLAAVALAAIVAGLMAVSMSGGLAAGAIVRFDTDLLLALRTPGDLARPIGPGWLTTAFIGVTTLGAAALRWLLGAVGVGVLLAFHRRADAAWLAASLIGSALLGSGLKAMLDRPRPQIAPHLIAVSGSGFPSGHALFAAAFYLTLGAIIARTQPRRAVRFAVYACTVMLVLLIGVSRVYLGVHWPSDVLAGWTVGAAWALTAFAAKRALTAGPKTGRATT